MTAVPFFTLNDGHKIPAVGYGTGTKWGKKGATELDEGVISAVSTSIEAGFVHIDGAESYGTEEEIGITVSKSGLKRDQFFITTKVLPHIADPAKALDTSLEKLGLDYVDLYLIHAPFVTKEDNGITLEDAWLGLEKLQAAGKAKSIGVSNFRVQDLERILKVGKVVPAVNQVEFSAYLQNQSPGIYQFSKKHGILLTAYSPLGPVTAAAKFPDAPLTPVLEKLAAKYNKSTAQITLRWTYQVGVLPITTSAKKERVKQSLDIFDFELTDAEVEEIGNVGAGFTFRQYWGHKFDSKNSRL